MEVDHGRLEVEAIPAVKSPKEQVGYSSVLLARLEDDILYPPCQRNEHHLGLGILQVRCGPEARLHDGKYSFPFGRRIALGPISVNCERPRAPSAGTSQRSSGWGMVKVGQPADHDPKNRPGAHSCPDDTGIPSTNARTPGQALLLASEHVVRPRHSGNKVVVAQMLLRVAISLVETTHLLDAERFSRSDLVPAQLEELYVEHLLEKSGTLSFLSTPSGEPGSVGESPQPSQDCDRGSGLGSERGHDPRCCNDHRHTQA